MISVKLTRRALLRGSAVAAAAATVTTLPIAAAAALPEADSVLEAWRAWRPLEEEDARLTVELHRIAETLPEWAFVPQTWATKRGGAPFHSVKFYDEFSQHGDLEHRKLMRDGRPNFVRRLRRAAAKAEAVKERSGWTAVHDQLEAIWYAKGRVAEIIEAPSTPTAVSIAARIDLLLAQSDELYLSDYPHCVACNIVRDLMPQLPPDMAAALEPIAAERGTIREAYLRGAAAEIGGAA